MQEDTSPTPPLNSPQADVSLLMTSQQQMIRLNSAVPTPSTITRLHLEQWFNDNFPASAGELTVNDISVCTLQEEPIPLSERVPDGPTSRRTVTAMSYLETLFWRAVAGQMDTQAFFSEMDYLEVVINNGPSTQTPAALNTREAKEQIKQLLNTTQASYERLLTQKLDEFWTTPADFALGRNVADWLAEELGTQLKAQADLHLRDTTLDRATHSAVTRHVAAASALGDARATSGVFSLSLSPQHWEFSLPVRGAIVLTRPDDASQSTGYVLYRPGHPLEVFASQAQLTSSLKNDDETRGELDTVPLAKNFLVHLVDDLRSTQKTAISHAFLNGPAEEEGIAAWVRRMDAATDIGKKLDLAGVVDEHELRLNLNRLDEWLHSSPHVTGGDRLAWWKATQALHQSMVDAPAPPDPVMLATPEVLEERSRTLLARYIAEKYPPVDPDSISVSFTRELIDPRAPTGISPYGSGLSQGRLIGYVDDCRSMTQWGMSNLTHDERNAAHPTVAGPLSFEQIAEVIERADLGRRLPAELQISTRERRSQWLALKANQMRAQVWAAHISGDLRHDKDNTGLNLVLAALDSPTPDRRAKVNGHEVVVRQLQWGDSVLKSILAFGVKSVASRPSLTLYTPDAPDGKAFRDVDASSSRTLEATLAQALTATPQMTRWLIAQLPLMEQAAQLTSLEPTAQDLTLDEKIKKVTQSTFTWVRTRAQADFTAKISSPVVKGNLFEALHETQITHAIKTAQTLTVSNAQRDSTAAREGRRSGVMLLTGAMAIVPGGRLGRIFGLAILPTMAGGAAVSAIDSEGGSFSQWTSDFISGLGEVLVEAGQDLIMARARRIPSKARPMLSFMPRMPDPELEPFYLRGFDGKGLVAEGRNRYRDTNGQGYLKIGSKYFKSAMQEGERIIYAPNNRTNQRQVTWENGRWQIQAPQRLLGGGPVQSLLGRYRETPEQKKYNILVEAALIDEPFPFLGLGNEVRRVVNSMPEELVVRILQESMQEVGMRDMDTYRSQLVEVYRRRIPAQKKLMYKLNMWLHADTAARDIAAIAEGFSLTTAQKVLIYNKIEKLGDRLIDSQGELKTVVTSLADNVTGATFLAITPREGKLREAVSKIGDAHEDVLKTIRKQILDELEPLFPGVGPDVENAKLRYIASPEHSAEYKTKFISIFRMEMQRRKMPGLLTEIRRHNLPYVIVNRGKTQQKAMLVTEEDITSFNKKLSSYDGFDVEVVTHARKNKVTGAQPPAESPVPTAPLPAPDKYRVDTSPLAESQMSYDNFPEAARAKVLEIMDDIRAGRVTTKRINRYYWYDMANLAPGGGRGVWRAAFERQGDTWTLEGFFDYHTNRSATVWGD
ncbi:dermonecrotic toxin domain-containing protein [Pseudomonas sp. ABY48]|uniref:dermonecrotic toxin domain-containing protein n=1 Tax=Pseudomonas sp. ABY48 TaxID=3402865 RepID=UPI003B439C6E